MRNLDMERRFHEETDIDIRPQLSMLATECGMFVLGCNVQHCEDRALIPHFIDAIESRMVVLHEANPT
jgi:hypothetical protein